jgi:hypothetical protein
MHKMALLSTDDWAVQPPPPSRPTFPRALKVDTWFTGTTTSAEAFGAIGDKDVRHLLTFLAKHKKSLHRITCVDACFESADGFAAMAEYCRHDLRMVSLIRTTISDGGALAAALLRTPLPKLEILCFYDCGVDDARLGAIGASLARGACPGLLSLLVRESGGAGASAFGPEAFHALFADLCAGVPRLQFLDLYSRNVRGAKTDPRVHAFVRSRRVHFCLGLAREGKQPYGTPEEREAEAGAVVLAPSMFDPGVLEEYTAAMYARNAEYTQRAKRDREVRDAWYHLLRPSLPRVKAEAAAAEGPPHPLARFYGAADGDGDGACSRKILKTAIDVVWENERLETRGPEAGHNV